MMTHVFSRYHAPMAGTGRLGSNLKELITGNKGRIKKRGRVGRDSRHFTVIHYPEQRLETAAGSANQLCLNCGKFDHTVSKDKLFTGAGIQSSKTLEAPITLIRRRYGRGHYCRSLCFYQKA
jgi:hypothetical protein